MRAVSRSFFALLLPLLVVAHDIDDHHARNVRHHQARQAPSGTTSASTPSSSSTSSTSSGTSTSAASGAGTSTGTGAVPPVASTTSFSLSLAATNPTAIPLASITANMPQSVDTTPLASTPAAGATPSFIPGAPPLPNADLIKASDYPPSDKPAPVDSPEVAQWKQEIANSGITIPDITPTSPGGCPNNTAILGDQNRCWWTCSGCTRDTDITKCPKPMQWGLTYDDGPGFHTSDLLHYLDEKSLKSTFFVVGSRVIQFPHVLQAQYMGQHQIAAHTWSHQPLTTLTNDQIIAELGWSRKAIKDVLGVTPNMMRPPFGDIDDRVRAISLAMGLVPVIWTRTSATSTFDTDDFNIHSGVTPVQKVLQNWENILSVAPTLDSGFIVLEHDLFQEAVDVATGYILPDALAHNPPFQIMPVVSCLNRAISDSYVETNNNKTNPPIATPVTGGKSDPSGKSDSSGSSGAARLYPLGSAAASALAIGATGLVFGFLSVLRI